LHAPFLNKLKIGHNPNIESRRTKMTTLTSHLQKGWNRLKGAFNLNDGRWGRHDHGHSGPQSHPEDAKSQSPQSGPPDLEELWRDFNQKLGRLLGSKKAGSGGHGVPNGPNEPPSPGFKSSALGSIVAGALVVLWLCSGFFIVQEGQQAVVTQFGRYQSTVGAGFNWRMPWPIQRHEVVMVTQIRSLDIGRDSIIAATGLRESAMLTADENILEIKFAVQYRLTDARAFLFESKNPTDAVIQAAETAVREVVGGMKMDAALSEDRDQIGPRVRTIMQNILDRYRVGIEIVGINLQQGGVRPPEQVQAAFDDVLKAGQERERIKNEAQAYANDVIPRAAGTASRLREEAQGYKSRIVAQAQGDAQRFKALYVEYQKAPQVTRDRLYIETMQQIYSNVSKVLVESKQGSNLLYLPLDKIMQMTASGGVGAPSEGPVSGSTPNAVGNAPNSPAIENRARDGRQRDRDVR
jgi:membrane protease subunit HflK